MVTEKTAAKPRKLSRVEGIKTASKHLRYPLPQELANSEAFITENAIQVMKFHGSYQQDNRELRKKGQQKAYQFMLRLKVPAGEFPPKMYQALDDLATTNGNNTLRATTRCAWQMHGILKGDLKTVFSKIMNSGGSTVGACGDLSRNVMCTPAPFVAEPYAHARFLSKMLAELFAPQTGAFSEIWLDGEKAASLEYWKNDIDMNEIQKIMRTDNGNGMVFPDAEEPVYGETYLPRKFKIGVTVPGDNSLDIYTQDIGIVVIPSKDGRTIEGYNLIVGGGMGRTHNKESTFARTGDHLGYVPANKIYDACKAIVAAQRDHGNRTLRSNARMKYLVHKLGIGGFKKLVESYYGEEFEPYKTTIPWKYEDWLGWHEQGDGNYFLGLFVENGRIKNEGDFKLKTAMRSIVDKYQLTMIVTPNQNIIFKDIPANLRSTVESILASNGVRLVEEYDMNKRISMACPALPLCGLAITEAERHMPEIVRRMNTLFKTFSVDDTPITMRMTGCPNGCARPYMAELGFVGSGPSAYQLWLGGCPNQTRLSWPYLDKVKDAELEQTLAPLLANYRDNRRRGEAFGDFCARKGKDTLLLDAEEYKEAAEQTLGEVSADMKAEGPNGVKDVTQSTATESAEKASPSKSVRVTIVRGPPKITVVPHTEKVETEVVTPVNHHAPVTGNQVLISKVEWRMTMEGGNSKDTKDQNADAANGASASIVNSEGGSLARKKQRRPRLTVSDDVMERLKNIAAYRDMSASEVADEIMASYLSSIKEDEEALEELD